VITTEDRATVQSGASAASGQVARLVSELERLLREPGCPACSYVSEIERSFFSWFQIESFSSPQVQGRLRAALGKWQARTERIAESFEIVDELTHEAGLVTSEMVPAMASLSEGERQRGGLRLARHRP
jgi:hypothetical protein